MPFKSKKQQAWMFANKPKMAKKWAAEMKASGTSFKGLPTRVTGIKAMAAAKPAKASK